jgi:hypothetical protein
VLVVWGAAGTLQYVGMETALYLAMIFAAVNLAKCKSELSLGVLLGCIASTRYDGVVAIGIILAYRWMQTRKLPRRTALVAGGVFGAWLVFAQIYFGSIMPNTLGAKASDTSFLVYWEESLQFQFNQLLRPLRRFGLVVENTTVSLWITGAVLLLPPLIRARRLSAQLWLLGAIAGFLWLAYSIIGPPAKHTWHLTLAILCLIALGLAGWGSLLSAKRSEKPLTVFTLILLVAASALLPRGANSETQEATNNLNYRDRVWSYESIGHWILAHGFEDEVLMTLEPGYISCLTGNPVVDAAGLVTKGIRFHGPVGERDTMASLADRLQPGMIINRTTTLVHPRLLENYTPVYGYRVMTLLMRKDLVAKHARVLAERWVKPTAPLLRPEFVFESPFDVNFRADRIPWLWRLQGLARAGFGRPVPGLRTPFKSFQDGYLSTKRSVGRLGEFARGPLIKIDSDVLTFEFGATDGVDTRVELLVDGVAVMKLGGHGPAAKPKVGIHRFPMDPWKGKFARLKLVDVGEESDFLVADGIRPQNRIGEVLVDDFDDGVYGTQWATTFSKSPTAAHWLVAKFGPAMALGSFSATSIGLGGKRQMRSKPFRIGHAAMSFIAFDFARNASSVKLVVNGKAVRQFSCENVEGMVPVVWPLGEWKGELAVLVVADNDQLPGRWMGIDSIVFFNGYEDCAGLADGEKDAKE